MTTSIAGMIYDAYKKEGDSEAPRGYLGASEIGHVCARYLWYKFRNVVREDIPGRIYRLFETGDREESRLEENLEAIGCEVRTADGNGEQFSVEEFGGHFSGHMDGCARGLPLDPGRWHLLEFKTHNKKSFDHISKNGVLKSKPQHYAQVQVYMLLSRMDCALYLGVCKDTDDIYDETIELDEEYAKYLIEKAHGIIFSAEIPERIANREDWYECKYCSAKKLCWNDGKVEGLPIIEIGCRSCCHSSPTTKGGSEWLCSKTGGQANAACDRYLALPGLFSFAEAVGSDTDTIVYRNNENGSTWACGNDGWKASELMLVPAPGLGLTDVVEKARDVFETEVIDVVKDVLLKHGDTAVKKWTGVSASMLDAWTGRYNTSMDSEEHIDHSVLAGDRSVWEFANGRIGVLYEDNGVAEIWEIKA